MLHAFMQSNAVNWIVGVGELDNYETLSDRFILYIETTFFSIRFNKI